uniref:C2 domain-containing protein n=1 Tax=Kalanchoe fedtschenkoi TaxID=63787 RepID=A0A7N0TCY2_KALFE
MENYVGLVRLRIFRGVNLAIRDSRSSDPYATVTMGDKKLKTRVVRSNCNPEWNDELTLCVSDHHLPIQLVI